jgi:hypothetical protein
VIDSLERVGSDKAVQVLILALTRLPNDEIVLKQEIERALAPVRTPDR